jgi:hypothetical protein
MTPSGPRTEAWSRGTPRTWTEHAEACATRSPIQTAGKLTPRAHMQEVENSRRHKKQPGGSRGRSGPKWAQDGRSSPFRARFGAPFDLAAIQTIYSPLAKSHTSIRYLGDVFSKRLDVFSRWSLRFDATWFFKRKSSLSLLDWILALHIVPRIRYLGVRHGYPWVPTDQGPKGPCQVDSSCQKPWRRASGPGDLIHNLGDPGRLWATLSRLQMTCRAWGASFSLDHSGGTVNRSEDCRILSIITEGNLTKSVTDLDEGPLTSNGNPSPPAI